MSYAYNFPTALTDVEPGDQTGEYYIMFSNLAFNSTWGELKDWLSTSCTVHYVEVFPISSCGWVCLQGTENFEAALTFMHCEPFKGRFLIIDARNRTESVMLRMKEYGPTPASAMGGGHSPCRTRNSAEGETCTVYDLEAVAAWAFLSFFINHVVGLMGLYDTPPMPPYAGLIPYPAWDGDDYTDLNALAMEPYVDEDPMQYDYDEEEYYSSDEYDSDDDDDLVD